MLEGVEKPREGQMDTPVTVQGVPQVLEPMLGQLAGLALSGATHSAVANITVGVSAIKRCDEAHPELAKILATLGNDLITEAHRLGLNPIVKEARD